MQNKSFNSSRGQTAIIRCVGDGVDELTDWGQQTDRSGLLTPPPDGPRSDADETAAAQGVLSFVLETLEKQAKAAQD